MIRYPYLCARVLFLHPANMKNAEGGLSFIRLLIG